MSYFAFVISVLLGIGSLAFVYAAAGYDVIAQGLLLIGAFWLYAGWKRWAWVSSMGLLLLVAVAGYGLWIELSSGWLLAGAMGGLLAWDLSEFLRRLDVAPESADLRELQLRHLTRLTLFAIVGLSLASIAMLMRLEFTFEWIMLLTFVGVLGITQLVVWLRR